MVGWPGVKRHGSFNSLGSFRLENASGLLKEEMRLLGSLIIEAADATKVPAGGALAVDRQLFAQYITDKIQSHPYISLIREEVKSIPQGCYVVIATGPLSSPAISEAIKRLVNQEYLYFFDAAAPIVVRDSLDFNKIFKASRYGRGEDYLNCPMTKEEYERFWHELVNAKTVALKEFEDEKVFEGCMPIEVMAKRGIDTLRFGPLKPVGLRDPRTGQEPYAVVHSRDGECRVCPLWGDAPQHLHQFAQAAQLVLWIKEQSVYIFCGANHRRGGVCGVGFQRSGGRA
ncbi:MAG: methylenetetrahydrofolate--tRNA-(uracil-5-)-methyltransferase [Clostridiales bacterium]|nr:methylenetetrahydrofolate--tRNA-(uracil-5-)-methyltransferase [Clostridiales bacterium]